MKLSSSALGHTACYSRQTISLIYLAANTGKKCQHHRCIVGGQCGETSGAVFTAVRVLAVGYRSACTVPDK